MRLEVKGPSFFSKHDEDAFFRWLRWLPAVRKVVGVGRSLHIIVDRSAMDDNQLRELLGLLARYKLDMRGLRLFETSRNRSWFRDREKYWFRKVFKA